MRKHGLDTRGVAQQQHIKVYDLTPEQVFTLWDGDQVTLEALERDFDVYRFWAERTTARGQVRGYGTLWEPSTTEDRVIVTVGREGLCLYDTKTEIKHRWKDREPSPDALGEQIKVLMAQMEAAQVRVMSKPVDVKAMPPGRPLARTSR